MPLYEFTCDACAHEFEELVRVDAQPPCPACGKARVRRKLSTFAAHGAKAPLPVGRPAGGCGRCGDPQGPCGLD